MSKEYSQAEILQKLTELLQQAEHPMYVIAILYNLLRVITVEHNSRVAFVDKEQGKSIKSEDLQSIVIARWQAAAIDTIIQDFLKFTHEDIQATFEELQKGMQKVSGNKEDR